MSGTTLSNLRPLRCVQQSLSCTTSDRGNASCPSHTFSGLKMESGLPFWLTRMYLTEIGFALLATVTKQTEIPRQNIWGNSLKHQKADSKGESDLWGNGNQQVKPVITPSDSQRVLVCGSPGAQADGLWKERAPPGRAPELCGGCHLLSRGALLSCAETTQAEKQPRG